MKKLYHILRGVFAVIGVAAVITALYIVINKDMVRINVDKTDLALCQDRLDSLRAAGPYVADTTTFTMALLQDTVSAKEIRDFFLIDTLYPADADTWTKSLAIAKFVASNIPHANQKNWPDTIGAIGLWNYTKQVAPAFNCRLHSIMTFELLMAAGIQARYITCMPMDEDDPDCHVVNEVWLPEYGKWAMLDSDMGGHYITDKKGVPLSLYEIRQGFIKGDKMLIYPAFENPTSRADWYYAYMAKNTYWFSCWGELSYNQEDYENHPDVVRDHYIHLVPSGFEPFGNEGTITTNAEKFWAPPTYSVN